ncbi:MAG TPA: cyclic nucleotide-binding domain-containing protein [Polyangiaceae bacterium]|nr:cyclic nucleotide-binding domain-containing protein [Polyangiaceae bacterium]
MNHELVDLGEPARVGLRDRVLLLRSQALFEALDDDGLLLLAEHAHTVSYADGEVVCAEGDPARAVHVVVGGALVVSRPGAEAVERGPGQAYGALPLLARQPATLVVARGVTRTLQVPATAWEAALIENHSMMRNMLRVMGSGVLGLRDALPADPNRPRVLDEGSYYTEPRSFVARLIDLRQSPFGHMHLEALVDLARRMIEVRYPAGALIWSVGDASTYSLHIDVGRVRCTAPDTRHVDVAHGFTIGILDVWGAQVRVYEARAETPLIGFRIEFEGFLSLLEVHPEMGLQLLRGFAAELLTASP